MGRPRTELNFENATLEEVRRAMDCTTVRYLHEQDYRLMVPRPWPLNQDEEARQAFCEKLQSWQKMRALTCG